MDDALAEIARLPGRHLYFLDDHLLGDRRFAAALFDGMRGMNRLFQGAATVDSILRGDLDRARGGGRAAQPLRRVRDADARQSRAAATSARTWAATTRR